MIRYDHRDTGRSTWAYDERPYSLVQLAQDALTVLDGLGTERVHIAGMSLGGMLAQLLIPGMGHTLPREVHTPLAAAILDHTTKH